VLRCLRHFGGGENAAEATRKPKSPEELLVELEAAYEDYAKIPHSVHTKAFHAAVSKCFVHPDKRVASAGLEMTKRCGCYRCRWLLKDVLHDSEATVGSPKLPSWEVLRSAQMVLLAMELNGRYVRGEGGKVAYHRRSAEDKAWFLCATYWQHRTTGRVMRWVVRKLSSVPHELAGEILEDIEKDVDRQVRKVGGGWLTIELQPAIKRSKRLQKMVVKAKNKFALLALEEAVKDDDPDFAILAAREIKEQDRGSNIKRMRASIEAGIKHHKARLAKAERAKWPEIERVIEAVEKIRKDLAPKARKATPGKDKSKE